MRNTRRERDRHRSAGFTLVEVVTVMVILGIIGLVPSFVIIESMRAYSRAVPAMTAKSMAELAERRIVDDVRELLGTDSISVFATSAFTFDRSGGQTVAYTLSGGNLLRNGDLLAEGVTALSFSYWKSDGTTASAAADVHLVELDLTVQSGTEWYRVQTVAFPRVLSP